ncbi:MAG TPA: hypothetical protein VF573_13690 [Paraburkholderia sp.]|uniref:hypothetical protein n=1 Tax=Paraburkholderia sp. TaxID=1926495 RepID=UPI002ED3B8AE
MQLLLNEIQQRLRLIAFREVENPRGEQRVMRILPCHAFGPLRDFLHIAVPVPRSYGDCGLSATHLKKAVAVF